MKGFSFKFIYLFIYLWLCWVFVSVRGLSLVVAGGGHSSPRCAGLSLSQALLLRSTGSRWAGSAIVAHGPSLLCGMWDLPRPGLEPVSPALAGRFPTAAPPGKPKKKVIFNEWIKKMWERSHGILFRHKRKEVHCENVDEPWGPYAKWNKSDRKRQYCLTSLTCGI